jgi:hypothetical protein
MASHTDSWSVPHRTLHNVGNDLVKSHGGDTNHSWTDAEGLSVSHGNFKAHDPIVHGPGVMKGCENKLLCDVTCLRSRTGITFDCHIGPGKNYSWTENDNKLLETVKTAFNEENLEFKKTSLFACKRLRSPPHPGQIYSSETLAATDMVKVIRHHVESKMGQQTKCAFRGLSRTLVSRQVHSVGLTMASDSSRGGSIEGDEWNYQLARERGTVAQFREQVRAADLSTLERSVPFSVDWGCRKSLTQSPQPLGRFVKAYQGDLHEEDVGAIDYGLSMAAMAPAQPRQQRQLAYRAADLPLEQLCTAQGPYETAAQMSFPDMGYTQMDDWAAPPPIDPGFWAGKYLEPHTALPACQVPFMNMENSYDYEAGGSVSPAYLQSSSNRLPSRSQTHNRSQTPYSGSALVESSEFITRASSGRLKAAVLRNDPFPRTDPYGIKLVISCRETEDIQQDGTSLPVITYRAYVSGESMVKSQELEEAASNLDRLLDGSGTGRDMKSTLRQESQRFLKKRQSGQAPTARTAAVAISSILRLDYQAARLPLFAQISFHGTDDDVERKQASIASELLTRDLDFDNVVGTSHDWMAHAGGHDISLYPFSARITMNEKRSNVGSKSSKVIPWDIRWGCGDNLTTVEAGTPALSERERARKDAMKRSSAAPRVKVSTATRDKATRNAQVRARRKAKRLLSEAAQSAPVTSPELDEDVRLKTGPVSFQNHAIEARCQQDGSGSLLGLGEIDHASRSVDWDDHMDWEGNRFRSGNSESPCNLIQESACKDSTPEDSQQAPTSPTGQPSEARDTEDLLVNPQVFDMEWDPYRHFLKD